MAKKGAKPKISYTIWWPDEKEGKLEKKIIGYITAVSKKQALWMFKQGWGRHVVEGAINITSIRDRLQAEANPID